METKKTVQVNNTITIPLTNTARCLHRWCKLAATSIFPWCSACQLQITLAAKQQQRKQVSSHALLTSCDTLNFQETTDDERRYQGGVLRVINPCTFLDEASATGEKRRNPKTPMLMTRWDRLRRYTFCACVWWAFTAASQQKWQTPRGETGFQWCAASAPSPASPWFPAPPSKQG